MAVLKISALLLNYPTFEGKTSTKLECLHFRIKKFMNLKVEKRSILVLKCTFLGQHRHNQSILYLDEKEELLSLMYILDTNLCSKKIQPTNQE